MARRGASRVRLTRGQLRSANANSELPEITATCCAPPTANEIGPLTIWPPRLTFHSSAPVRASSAWKYPSRPPVKSRSVRGRQDAAVGDVVLIELPLLLAGLRIDRDHRAVAGRVGPVVDRRRAADPDAGRAGHRRQPACGRRRRTCRPATYSDLLLPEDRRVAFPRGDVEQPGARADTTANTSSCRPGCPATSARREAAASGSAGPSRRGRSPSSPSRTASPTGTARSCDRARRRSRCDSPRASPWSACPRHVDVGEHRDLHRVVVVRVVRRELEVPLQRRRCPRRARPPNRCRGCRPAADRGFQSGPGLPTPQ